MSPKFKFYFFGFGIPFFLVVFWSGNNLAQLASNYWKIRQLRVSLAKLSHEKEALEQEATPLEKNDPAAWTEFLRRRHALKPAEVEYRFK